MPLTQSSRYEINNRKYITKLDKDALIRKEVLEWVHKGVIYNSYQKLDLKKEFAETSEIEEFNALDKSNLSAAISTHETEP